MQVGQGFYFTIHDLFNASPFEIAIDVIVFVFEKAKNRGSECRRSGLMFVYSEKESRVERQVTASGN